MGQEITQTNFDIADFKEFRQRVKAETSLLKSWLQDGLLSTDEPMGGCELEAWLVDGKGAPAPVNQTVLTALDEPLAVPELSTFNVELNTQPGILQAGFLDNLYKDINDLWQRCDTVAQDYSARMLMIGVLPTVRQADLSLDFMSPLQRYRALNEQVIRMREGAPLQLDIRGREHLQLIHDDVMLEAAATSFQLHLKVDAGQAVKAYNLSKILSAPMVAISANSPYLFGYDLWDETRIPLFEQSVAVGASDYTKRVSFGIRYARNSIIEVFEANRDRYPILLPGLIDAPEDELAHLCLHNGTIWRWNRPLIGFSDDGKPHVRIEHRVASSGPSCLDIIANAAFYFGTVSELMATQDAVETKIPFLTAKDNFYRSACSGLDAEITWFDGQQGTVRELCLQQLIPAAVRGLLRMGFSAAEAERWLDIVRLRVSGRQTGAAWQRAWIASHGKDFSGLVNAYAIQQQSGLAVHEWTL